MWWRGQPRGTPRSADADERVPAVTAIFGGTPMRHPARAVCLLVCATALVVGCQQQKAQFASGAPEPATSITSNDTGRTVDNAVASGGDAVLSPDVQTGDTYSAQGQVQLGRRSFGRGQRRGSGPLDEVELQQAVTHYDKAIALDPTLAEGYCGRGDVRLELGQAWVPDDFSKANSALQDAIADYTKAIELDPQDLAAYLGRGSTHQALRDYGPALADFEKALDCDPGNEDARARIKALKDEAGMSGEG
jgi:hypothetical protein